MMKSNPVAEKVNSMVLNSDRALAIFKSGNISRSRHLPVVPSGLFVSGIFTQDCVPQALTCLECFSSNLPQNRHPERSASQIYRVVQRLMARSRRTPKMLILSMLFGAFRLPKPEN